MTVPTVFGNITAYAEAAPQGYELLATASGEKFFEPNEKSEPERLQMLYVDSKHMDRMIE